MAHKDAVTRLRREEVDRDRYGLPVYEEISTELPVAQFAPRGVIPSPVVGREPVVVEPTLYWRMEWPDVVASDRLVVRGETFEVQTQPADWRGKITGGLVVNLREAREGVA